MSTINIGTSQNVYIEHNLAGLGARIGAFIIDVLIMIAYAIVAYLIFGAGLKMESSIGWLIVYVPLAFYHLLSEILWNGQSLGKRTTKIKVVRLDGAEPTVANYFLRWLLRVVDISLFSGGVAIVSIIVTERGQRLGDLVAGTTVVSTEVKRENFEMFAEVDENYQIQFPEVAVLSEEDIILIRDVMKHVQNVRSTKAIDLAYKTKIELEKKMDIKSELKASDFFAQILTDYTAHHARLSLF